MTKATHATRAGFGAPGASPPQKQGAAPGEVAALNEKLKHRDSGVSAAPAQAPILPTRVDAVDRKAFATLHTRAALAGVVVHLIDGDDGSALFVASKWSLTRQMGSPREVEEFLRRIAGERR